MRPLFLGLICGLVATVSAQWAPEETREDDFCGPENPAPNGEPALCKDIPPYPTCCTVSGHCGWDCDGIPTNKVLLGGGDSNAAQNQAPKKTTPKPVYQSTGLYRADGRCGAQFPVEGTDIPAECDPNSQYWCCSENGWCGGEQEHCYCDTCVNYRPIKEQGKVRSDRRCGKEFPLNDGSPGQCDPLTENPCCSKWGYCGPGDSHCACPECIDFRESGDKKKAKPKVQKVIIDVDNEKVRLDRRCGKQFPLEDGTPSECDPNSVNPCCSQWGFCGPGASHCACPTCTDFRSPEQKAAEDFVGGKVRTDRRCGKDFKIPGTNDPSECDPNSENFCCSEWGFCGGDADHCNCAKCVNYAPTFKK